MKQTRLHADSRSASQEISRPFIPEGPVLCLQYAITGPCFQPDESNPHSLICFSKIRLILSSHLRLDLPSCLLLPGVLTTILYLRSLQHLYACHLSHPPRIYNPKNVC